MDYQLSELQEQFELDYDARAYEFFDQIRPLDQTRIIYYVVSTIFRGEAVEQGSYRYILYDLFGFGPESYGIGMMAGFLDIHNKLYFERPSRFKAVYSRKCKEVFERFNEVEQLMLFYWVVKNFYTLESYMSSLALHCCGYYELTK